MTWLLVTGAGFVGFVLAFVVMRVGVVWCGWGEWYALVDTVTAKRWAHEERRRSYLDRSIAPYTDRRVR